MSTAGTRFLAWGRENGQFAGVVLGILAITIYTATTIATRAQRHLQEIHNRTDLLEADLRADLRAVRLELRKERSDILRQQNERFLTYGYASEYQRLRKSAMPSERVTQLQIDEDGTED